MKGSSVRLIFGFIFVIISLILLVVGPDYSATLFAAMAAILFITNIILERRDKK